MANSKLVIEGGRRLSGEITISGSKNAALPLMTAALLTGKPVNLSNVPNISDVQIMKSLLQSYGVGVTQMGNNQFRLVAENPQWEPSDPSLSGKLRASTGILGSLLARLGSVVWYKSGGDDISKGGRGIDFHISGFRKLGATVEETDAYIRAYVPSGRRLQGARIYLPKVSVGATQNIMAACAATGTTVIENASIEPETMDLVELLKKIGAGINVDKPNRKITIQGKPVAQFSAPQGRNRQGIDHTVIPDRIEAATYAIAAIITRGTIKLKMNVSDQMIMSLLEAEFWRILAAGAAEIRRTEFGLEVRSQQGSLIEPVSVRTNPYPGFPTDLHPQWAALMCFSSGQCWIEENVFDDRFKYVGQLQRTGAAIQHDGRKTVHITGNATLRDRRDLIYVEATDIRAGAALILAALARKGVTEIYNVSHLNRGYENFLGKFTSCGAAMMLQEY